MTTYSDYKDHILASLWRTNDTVVSNNLDTIIKRAENELRSRTHDWQRRQKTITITLRLRTLTLLRMSMIWRL